MLPWQPELQSNQPKPHVQPFLLFDNTFHVCFFHNWSTDIRDILRRWRQLTDVWSLSHFNGAYGLGTLKSWMLVMVPAGLKVAPPEVLIIVKAWHNDPHCAVDK